MPIKIAKISLMPSLRISSHRNMTKPAIRFSKGTPLQVIAQGHDKTIFSDIDMGSSDAITMEVVSQHHTGDIQKRKKLNASIASNTAIRHATNKGHATTIEYIQTDNRTMPYGICSKTDKKDAEILLNTLKKRYSRH
jgi:hypothetical protein